VAPCPATQSMIAGRSTWSQASVSIEYNQCIIAYHGQLVRIEKVSQCIRRTVRQGFI
jgi:hypothetical protein